MAVVDDVQDEGPGWGGKVALAGCLLAVAGGIYWAVTSFHSGGSGPKRQTVKIAVLPDTPPPTPSVQEKKPEPEIKEQKPQPQQEEQKPLDKAPEPEQIKMEGEAGNGASPFINGSVTKDYVNGDPNTVPGEGGNRLQEALFGRRLQKHIQLALARDKSIKLGDYRVKVSVWLDERGVIQRVQLDEPTGDDKIDRALRDSFGRLPTISDMPAGIRQPVRLAISNRMTG